MIPKAPRAAQILITLFAVLVLVYSASVLHLSDDSPSGKRRVLPGQLIAVQMHSAWDSMRSSDDAVLVPISITLRPVARGYFLALKPGGAVIQAAYDPCPASMAPPRCMAAARMWVAVIEVWPG